MPSAALRRMRHRPGFTLLNVLGLAVGMACCLLIGLYVQHETSYDRFHPDADRIVRVIQRTDDGGRAVIGGAASPLLRSEVPGVEAVTGVTRNTRVVVRPGTGAQAEVRFEEDDFMAATPEFFDVLGGFELLRGEPGAVLDAPNEVVLTQSAATKYFGADDPVGQTLRLAGGQMDEARTLTVTGIMADPPANAHLRPAMVASVGTVMRGRGRTTFGSGTFWYPSVWMYARLAPGTDRLAAERTLRDRVAEQRRPEVAARYRVELQPLTDIHLGSDGLGSEPTTPGSRGRVAVFAAIAAFVLLIAGVNFMNLATARASERALEVGVRKTLGASGQGLVRQFLGEALLLSGVAATLALGLTALAVPVFEGVLGIELAYGILGNPVLWAGALAVVLVTGLGAGSYPAFVLARFDPATALRDLTEAGHARSARLRKGLVVAQFALTVVIVAATMVAVQQLRYMQTKSLGFDSERLVVMDAEGDLGTLTAELERRPEITAVTTTGYRPGMQGGGGYRYEVNGQRPDEEEERIQTQMVGAGFFDMLDVEVVAGRVPSADRPADLGIGYDRDDTHFFPWWREVPMVINRSTADKFGWTPEEALGQTLRLYIVEGETYYGDYEGPVVGVVEDYHTRSLREAIAPTVFYPTRLRAPGGEDAMFVNATTVLAKAAPGDAAQTMDALAAVWAQVNPQAILDASFLDADLQQLYDAERRVGRVMGAFAGLAVFVACLGLVGLATYTAERRTKEIGIRKALGASVPGIVGLLSKDFLKLVAVAVALGLPVAYLLAERWLEQFAYRISPGVGLFAACTVLVLALAALAVGTQTLRAARTDPAAVLRAE